MHYKIYGYKTQKGADFTLPLYFHPKKSESSTL